MRHLTATCFLIHEEKILLVYHQKFSKWLPPGGHVESHEAPHEAAFRETLEETGLHITLIDERCSQRRIFPTSYPVPAPYACFIEQVPALGDAPAHEHIDFLYRGRCLSSTETPWGRWWTLEEMQNAPPSLFFPETLALFEEFLSSPIPTITER